MTDLHIEALRLATWHEERAHEVEREAHRYAPMWQDLTAWRQLDTIREYHDATAKTLRALAAQLMATV